MRKRERDREIFILEYKLCEYLLFIFASFVKLSNSLPIGVRYNSAVRLTMALQLCVMYGAIIFAANNLRGGGIG